MEDLTILCDRIRVMLDQRHGAPADDVEHTLTDGYARALALEGERRRAEHRLQALAGNADHLDEQRALKSHLGGIDDQLAELRRLLGVLAATL
jgi:hypothetical protein